MARTAPRTPLRVRSPRHASGHAVQVWRTVTLHSRRLWKISVGLAIPSPVSGVWSTPPESENRTGTHKTRFPLRYTARGNGETLAGESASWANVIWHRIAISEDVRSDAENLQQSFANSPVESLLVRWGFMNRNRRQASSANTAALQGVYVGRRPVSEVRLFIPNLFRYARVAALAHAVEGVFLDHTLTPSRAGAGCRIHFPNNQPAHEP